MVNLDNGKLSERQVFRIGVIENIAVGIVLLPFVAINIAGKMHVWALLTGVIFTFNSSSACIRVISSRNLSCSCLNMTEGIKSSSPKSYGLSWAIRSCPVIKPDTFIFSPKKLFTIEIC